MNNIATQMEFASSESALKVQSSNESGLVAELDLSWNFLSALADNYLRANRGRRLTPDHYKQVLAGEVERMVLARAKEISQPVLDVSVELPKDAGLHSKSIKARVTADWFPHLPDLKTDDMTIKQFKLDQFTKEEIQRVKDQFLDSNQVPVEWDGEIQKGDMVRVIWKWKMDEKHDWTSESDESTTLVKVGINPRLEPALEEKLIGSKKGSAVEHVIKVPTNINEGSVNPQFAGYIKDIVKLAGKSVHLRLEVVDVQRPQRPELDEKLLKKYNLESEEALEEKIRGNLHDYVVAQNNEIAFAQILDYLRKADVIVPERYSNNYAKYLLSRFASMLNVRPGKDGYELDSTAFQKTLMEAIATEFDSWNYISFSEFETKVKQVAREVMAGDFMINQVIKLVDLTEDALQSMTLQAWLSMDEASRKSMSEPQIREYFKNARHRAALSKLLDLLKEQGKVEEIESSSLKEFEKSILSISDDALHTKYFGPVNR